MLTWKDGHSYVREDLVLRRVVDFEEVFRVRADLRSDEKLGPTGLQFQRRDFLEKQRAGWRRETSFSNRFQRGGEEETRKDELPRSKSHGQRLLLGSYR